MKQSRVYIIIVNFLKWQDTKECIDSVLASGYKEYSIIVVDNNSGNQSLECLQKEFSTVAGCRIVTPGGLTTLNNIPPLLFVQNEKNTGFGAANNIIIRRLLEEDAYIWLLNPDMTVRPNTLKELIDFAEKQTEKKIIGSVVYSYAEKNKLLFYGGGRIRFRSATVKMITSPEQTAKADYISGTSLFAHVSLFKLAGLFQEDYFLYWEETDWCYTARAKGIALSVCFIAVCYDKESSVIGKGLLAEYYYTRNGLYFVSKFKRGNKKLALLMAVLRLFKRILLGQWQRAAGIKRGITAFLKRRKYEME